MILYVGVYACTRAFYNYDANLTKKFRTCSFFTQKACYK